MSRKTRRGTRIFSALYSPISHFLKAGKKSVGSVTNAAKGIVGKGINGVNGVGRAVTGEMNEAVSGLKRGFSRKARRGGKRTTRRANRTKRSNRR